MAAIGKPNDIVIIRIYEAPVKAVWEAWTDPDQAAKWWGPRGFTITTKSKDLRVGGQWVYTMHGPDGVNYPNATTYHEVEKFAKLVYDHGSDGISPPLFRVTVLFSEHHGKTTMHMTMALDSAEAAIETRKFIKQAGGDATWDRLAEHLEHEATGQDKFFINRTLEASQDHLFKVLTEPAHIEKWMPPIGFSMRFNHVEIKPGGRSFYVMSNEAGMKMYGRTEYLEITPPSRLVYKQQFCDEKERITRHPMSASWPETMLTVVTLAAEDAAHTRITLEWSPYGSVTATERATFIGARAGMTQGWTGSFDKLEEYLMTAAR